LLEHTEYAIDKPITDGGGKYVDPTQEEAKRLKGDDTTFFDVSTVSPAPTKP
jgi:hypothetical protein